MRIKLGSYLLIFWLLVGLYVVMASLRFGSLEATLAPLLLGSGIVVLSAIQLWKELAASKLRVSEELRTSPGAMAKDSIRFATLLGWVAGLIVGIYLLGFLIATTVFVFCYLKSKRQGWRPVLIIPASMTAILYVVFEIGLGVRLYPGLFFS